MYPMVLSDFTCFAMTFASVQSDFQDLDLWHSPHATVNRACGGERGANWKTVVARRLLHADSCPQAVASHGLLEIV